MRIPAFLLLCLLTIQQVFASNESEPPQNTLDAYFQVLTSRDISNLAGLMDSANMAKLKRMMDAALQEEIQAGGNRLQRRLFSKSMTSAQVEQVSAAYYLEQIAGDIQKAANMQRFFVARRDILGRIDENVNLIHYVVRLYLEQGGKTTSELYVYTLVRENDQWKLEFPPIIKQSLTMFEATIAR